MIDITKLALSQSVSFSLGRSAIINPRRSAMSERDSGNIRSKTEKEYFFSQETIKMKSRKVGRIVSESQTLYNECALENRKRFGGLKITSKRKYTKILTCKNKLQGGPYSRS